MKQCVVEKYCSHKYQEEIKTKRLFTDGWRQEEVFSKVES